MKNFMLTLLLSLVTIGCLLVQTPSQTLAEAPAGFTSLFNGKDLSGWKGLVGDPKKRAAMSPAELAAEQKKADQQMRDHWKVVDGVLNYDGKGNNPCNNLCTVKDYGDFELYVDWKILEDGDSGIYLRGSPQVQIWDTQSDIYRKLGGDKGSGALYNNQKNPRFPLKKADKPVGQWNTFYIKMVGERVTVKLNGELIVDNVIMENLWERDKPIYERGQIELQSHGRVLWFRNIYIRELDSKAKKQKAISPKDKPIKLFNGKNLDGFYSWIRGDGFDDPRRVFTVKDGILRVSGDGWGGLITNESYRDYHLIIEFKWGGKTWDSRVDRARDSGLLLHCHGPDGGYSGIWMTSFEAQIIEGGVGDILVLSTRKFNGKAYPTSATVEITKDRDGERVWKKGGKRINCKGGRINWWGRDPDWADKKGFRGKDDVESPFGEWTRMDVICDGGHMLIKVNGKVVNEAFDADPSEGKILLQTELAELLVRRWELWPLGKAPK